MNEGTGISMQYNDMELELSQLEACVTEFEDTIAKMTASVNRLCGSWVAEATKSYREDYMATQKNLNETVNIVNQLIADNRAYIADMKATDSSYTGNKVYF